MPQINTISLKPGIRSHPNSDRRLRSHAFTDLNDRKPQLIHLINLRISNEENFLAINTVNNDTAILSDTSKIDDKEFEV